MRTPRRRIQEGERMTDAPGHDDRPESLSRREMIEVTAAALAAPLLPVSAATAAAAPRLAGGFLTTAELALLDQLTELIIPTDEHSPGARAAGVAAYVAGRLAESLEPEWQASWRSRLQAGGRLSPCPPWWSFLRCSPRHRAPVLPP